MSGEDALTTAQATTTARATTTAQATTGRFDSEPPTAAMAPGVVLQSAEDVADHAMSKLFGRDSLFMIVWAVQLVIGAGLTPVITRLMGGAQFGQVAAATAVMQVLFVLTGLGMETAVQRHYAGRDGPADSARLLGFAILAASLVTATADLTGQWWSGALGFSSYSGGLRLATAWAGVSAVTAAVLSLLRSQDRLVVFACVSLLQSVVAALASLVLLRSVAPTAQAFLLGQLALQVAATVLGLVFVRPRWARWRDRHLVRRALGYGLPLVPAGLSAFVLAAADRLIIQRQLGPTAVARYQIAYNVGALPILVLTMLSSSWLPRLFALGDGVGRAEVMVASREALYRLLCPVLAGLAVGAPILLRLWAPSSYQPDQLLIVATLVIVTVLPFTAGLGPTQRLMVSGRTSTVAVANFVAAVVNIALNVALVPRFGLQGSAAATLGAYVLLCLLLALAAKRVAPIPPSRPGTLVLLGLVVLVAAVQTALPATPVVFVVRGFGAAATVVWFSVLLIGLHRRRRPV